MAKANKRPGARQASHTRGCVLVALRQRRGELLRGTALQAAALLVLAVPAAAQPAPGARPQGGRVVAGAASIAQTATATTSANRSQRAAMNWGSFDVGGDQSVTFQQPSASAVTLNRVTGGTDPSAIAGKISANGQIIITNQNGVVFYPGAEVNAQSVVVSAAGISNRNFMAGRMVFDRPAQPSARVVNQGVDHGEAGGPRRARGAAGCQLGHDHCAHGACRAGGSGDAYAGPLRRRARCRSM